MQSVEKLKSELAQALEEPVEITAFKCGEPAPFCLVIDDVIPIADDSGRVYALKHSISIEHYTETNSENSTLTAYLLREGMPFSFDQTYLDEERLFISVFSLENDIIEKLKE